MAVKHRRVKDQNNELVGGINLAIS